MPPDRTPIKRISLVRFRSELGRDECVRRWLGSHADIVRRLSGVREYTIDVLPNSPHTGGWDAIATLRFDDEEAMRRSLEAPEVAEELLRTREAFAEAVHVMLVDEHTVIPPRVLEHGGSDD